MHKLTFEIPEDYIDHYDHVNHGKYFQMYENSQEIYLQERGASFEDLERGYGVRFVQRALRIEYFRPLLLEDIVDISTSIKSVGTTSFAFEQKRLKRKTFKNQSRKYRQAFNSQGHFVGKSD